MASGVERCRSTCRNMVLTVSDAPTTIKAPNVSGSDDDSPNTTVAAPYTVMLPRMPRPALWMGGSNTSNKPTVTLPSAGTAKRKPN